MTSKLFPNQGMSLINLVSGDFHNMRQGFASSNMKFDMLGFSDLPADCIRNRIVIVDDSILPLDSKELQPLVSLTKNKGQHPVSWNTSRDKIMELIA